MRLLFLQAHPETDHFFAASGVHHAQPNRGQFHYRHAAFFSQLKAKADLVSAKAAALRITLNIDVTTTGSTRGYSVGLLLGRT